MSPSKALMCQSCMRQFTSKAQFKKRSPLLLDCGHSLCEECCCAISTASRNSYTCSHCHQETEVKAEVRAEGGKLQLPPHTYLNGCLVVNAKPPIDELSISFVPAKAKAHKQASTEKAGVKRSISEKDKCEECCLAFGSLLCAKCEDHRFCEACFQKVHSGSKLLSRHVPVTVQPDSGQQEGDGGASGGQQKQVCRLHDGRALEYYCTEDSTVICSHCVITGEHKGHTIEALSDRNATRFGELREQAEKGRNRLSRLRMAIKGLRTAPATAALNTTALLDSIQEHFTQLHGRLQLRQQQLTEELVAAANSQRDHVQKLGCQLEERWDELAQVLADADRVLSGAADPTLNVEQLLTSLDAAVDQPCFLVWADPNQQDCQVRFLANQQLLTSIERHGNLDVDIPPPVQLVSESDLPADYVIPDVVHDLTDETDSVKGSAGSVGSDGGSHPPSVGAVSTLQVVGVANKGRRQLVSPRPAGESRLAAVFPGLPPLPPPPVVPGTAPPPVREPPKQQPALPASGPYGQEPVLVTHVRSPWLFYVQRSSQQRQLAELMRRVAQWCCRPEILANKSGASVVVEKNSMCLAQYSADQQWYRCRILDVYPPNEERASREVEVFYVDFGNQERVVESRLRPITSALARDPDMALCCCLWDLQPAGGAQGWSQQATHTFAQLVRSGPVLMTTIKERDCGVRDVELLRPPNKNIKSDTARSVRDHLVFVGQARYVNPSSRCASSAADQRRFYPAEQLRRGSQQDVLVSHVDSPDSFYVQQLGVHAEYLTNMMDEMQPIYANSKDNTHTMLSPREGQVCVARFSVDSKFYRAVIEKLLPQMLVDVFYVDYGNRERVALDAIKKIEDRFMVIPIQAIRCRLADVLPLDPKQCWTEAATLCLMEATDMKQLKLYVDAVEDHSHTVTLYECRPDADVCINALLVQQLCARGVGPSTRMVEYTKVDWEPVKGPRAAALPCSPASASQTSGPASGPPSVSSSTTLPAAVPGHQQKQVPSVAGPAVPTGDRSPIRIFVSHYESPNRLFVQVAEEIPALNKLMDDMQSVYGEMGASSQGYRWSPGNVAVARCGAENRFYRVRVQGPSASDPHKLMVCLIDYGNVETVPSSAVVSLLETFTEHKGFALQCHLHGIRPAGDSGTWTGYAVDFLKNMVSKSEKLFLIHKGVVSDVAPSADFSLPADLEAEEERNVGALEPLRRIRVSLSQKLIEQGLAFPLKRGQMPPTVTPAPPVSLTAPAAHALSPAVPALGDMVPSSMDVGPSGVEQVDSFRWDLEPEDAETTLVVSDPESTPEQRSVGDADEPREDEDIEDIPLGADWSLMKRERPPEPPPERPGDNEHEMLEAEAAAEQVEARLPAEVDWLPARVPTDTELIGIPTHVTMSGTVFLHTVPKGKETLEIIKQALKKKYENSEPRPCDMYWFEGMPCIAKYFLDKCWYRARVLKVHKEKVSVLFVDYGNTDKVDMSHLRKNIYMEDVPIQALHCVLYNVVPLAEDGHFTVKTLDFIHTQIVERECRVIVHHFCASRRRFLVTLQLRQSGIDVNEMLVKLGDARYMTDEELEAAHNGDESPADTLLLRSPYPRLRLPTLAPVSVVCTVLLAPNLVFVQPTVTLPGPDDTGPPPPALVRLNQHVETVCGLRDRLQELAPQQPPLRRVVVGAACLSQYSMDQVWYRAFIISLDRELAKVQYVDWGNIEEVPVSSLREIPAELLSPPAWALLVELYQLSSVDASGWDQGAAEAMSACLFRQDVALFTRVKRQSEPPVVELVVAEPAGGSTEEGQTSGSVTLTLAYQQALDDGAVVLRRSTRRQ